MLKIFYDEVATTVFDAQHQKIVRTSYDCRTTVSFFTPKIVVNMSCDVCEHLASNHEHRVNFGNNMSCDGRRRSVREAYVARTTVARQEFDICWTNAYRRLVVRDNMSSCDKRTMVVRHSYDIRTIFSLFDFLFSHVRRTTEMVCDQVYNNLSKLRTHSHDIATFKISQNVVRRNIARRL